MGILEKLSQDWEVVQEWMVVDKKVIWAIAAVIGTGTLAKLVHYVYVRHKLAGLRRQKQTQCQQAFENLANKLARGSQISKQQKREILSLSFTELQTALKSEQFTPTQVLHAYQSEALDVHGRTNCLQEPFLEAESLALELQTQDKKDLPLFGIPVSIKDGYGVEGYDCTLGVSRLVGQPFSEDSVIIKVLKDQGAIPYVRTNVPQLLFSYETSNPIHGLTTNPLNQARGAGGSSGGEGALIAGGGSVLGFGSDIGGSLRIPAAFCGICSMKPTQSRFSEKGMPPLGDGQTLLRGDFGPMSQEVDALVAAYRALMSPLTFQLDPPLPPVTFNEQMFGSTGRLRVGYYVYDGVMHAVPSCERAVREAVQQLQALGHEVVEWNFSKYGPRLFAKLFAILFADGGKGLLPILAGDKIDRCLNQLMQCCNPVSNRLLAYTAGLLNPHLASVLKGCWGVGSVSEWWEIGADTKSIREEVIADWLSLGLDVVVLPGMCSPAMPHGMPGNNTGPLSTTAPYNVLHFPVGSLRVSSVKKEDLSKMDTYPTPDSFHRMVKEAQPGSEGLPVGVQVAALPWHDELCLRVMKELETALKR